MAGDLDVGRGQATLVVPKGSGRGHRSGPIVPCAVFGRGASDTGHWLVLPSDVFSGRNKICCSALCGMDMSMVRHGMAWHGMCVRCRQATKTSCCEAGTRSPEGPDVVEGHRACLNHKGPRNGVFQLARTKSPERMTELSQGAV